MTGTTTFTRLVADDVLHPIPHEHDDGHRRAPTARSRPVRPATMAMAFTTWHALSRRERVEWRAEWVSCRILRPEDRPFLPDIGRATIEGWLDADAHGGGSCILRFGDFTLNATCDMRIEDGLLETQLRPTFHATPNPHLGKAAFEARHGLAGRTTIVGGQAAWERVHDALLDLAAIVGTGGYALMPADGAEPPDWAAIEDGAIVADERKPLAPDPADDTFARLVCQHIAAATLPSARGIDVLPHTAALPASATLMAARKRGAAERLADFLTESGADPDLVAGVAARLSTRPA